MSKKVLLSGAGSMKDGEIRTFQIGERAIALCRVDGKYYAFDEICSHQYASLAEGWLQGYAIECPMHGAQFDIRTGEALSLPAVEKINTFPIAIEGEQIYVIINE